MRSRVEWRSVSTPRVYNSPLVLVSSCLLGLSNVQRCSAFVSSLFIRLIKDLVRVCHTNCVLTVVRRLSSSSFLSPPIALCVSVFGDLILHAYIVLLSNSAIAVRGEEEPVTSNLTLCPHQVVAKATFNYYFTIR